MTVAVKRSLRNFSNSNVDQSLDSVDYVIGYPREKTHIRTTKRNEQRQGNHKHRSTRKKSNAAYEGFNEQLRDSGKSTLVVKEGS